MASSKITKDGQKTGRAFGPQIITLTDVSTLRRLRMLELDKEFVRQTRELKRLTKALKARIPHL